jgi:paraquat-inducible protein B
VTMPTVAEPEVRRRRRLSPIWAFPIIAVLVGIWLAYTTLSEKGPTIAIDFKTAAGIEAGKTRIKHNEIELGVVDRIEPARDLSHVSVIAKMNKRAEDHLTDETRFWVVRPRLSLSSLSGIETLISGAYIEMDPVPGKSARRFVGLEEPPVVRAAQAGREFVLTTDRVGSIGRRSPVYHRGIKVGEVMDYDASDVEGEIKVHLFVYAPYDSQVFDGTRFWNASGISISAGANGFRFEIESLDAVLSGGVAFETPESARRGEPSKELATFTLFPDRATARDAGFTRTVRQIVEFTGSVHGLEIGAPVEFRGIKVGRVLDFYLAYDPAKEAFQVPVTIEVEIERIRLVSGDYAQFGGGRLMPALVAKGLRAQLRSTSLLTGQLMVAFDFFPDAPPATIDTSGPYPKVPSVPSKLEAISQSIEETLNKLSALPLDAVVDDLRGILKSTQGLVDSPELKASLVELQKTLTGAERLVGKVDVEAGPLLQQLRQAAEAASGAVRRADITLRSVDTAYGSDSTVRTGLVDLLRQLRDAARSIKALADYVEQHPESVIRGKTGGK